MKTTKYALAVTLGLIALIAPGTARANSVLVTMNVAISGSSVCGAMNNALCVENLSGSFVWDNSSMSAVPGTIAVNSISGPINFATLSVSGLLISLLPPQDSIRATFSDPGGDFATFGINFATPNLPLGTYTYTTGSPLPGTFNQVGGQCVTAVCNADLSNTTTFGTVTVTATPEPSSLLLLGTGLLGLTAVTWRGKRLA